MPAYHDFAAGQSHVHLGIKQPEILPRDDRRTGAGAAGGGLTDTALEHAQIDEVPSLDANETGVGFLGKPLVALDLRADVRDRRGADVVNLEYAMGIAHRYDRDVVLDAVDVERIPVGAPFGDEAPEDDGE